MTAAPPDPVRGEPKAASFAPLAEDASRSARPVSPSRDSRGRNVKTTPGSFLGGAIGRLLPASIPFRYFGAAAVFHVAAWVALLAGADGAPHYRGGLGWTLAALHLVTLGVLTMTAIGASLQLLPVATRQAVRSRHAPALVFWLYTPGVAAAALGMGVPSVSLLAAGAVLVAIALAIYAVLLARNLFGARGMPAVVAHVWIAWIALVIVLIAALSLALAYAGRSALPRPVALALHVPFAAYGFMGMLALGLSYILVPMFALSQPPDERSALLSCALAGAAFVAIAAAAFGIAAVALRIAAIIVGAVAVALHLRLMSTALAKGMRRDLGPSFRLVRIGWAMLAASLVAALGVVLDVPFAGMPTLFGLLLIAGWLLTFLLGILQRIVPFLASMHASRGKHRPPTPSSLAAGPALRIHFVCHVAALAVLITAIVADNAWLARIGALAGLVGAMAFIGFLVQVVRRMFGAGIASRSQTMPG